MSALARLTRALSDTLYAPLTTSPKIWTAVVDPAITDDTTPLGVKPGDIWVNTATGNIFDNVSAANGAAIWAHRPRVIDQSSVAITHTGPTIETLMKTVVIPANVMGVNGMLDVHAHWAANASDANVKTPRIRYAAAAGGLTGTALNTVALTNVFSYRCYIYLGNRAATNSQISTAAGTAGGIGTSTGAAGVTAAIDTTLATEVAFTGTLATGTDSIILQSYKITLTRPNIGPT